MRFEKARSGTGVIVSRWTAATGRADRSLEIVTDTDAIWPTLDRRHVALRRAHEQSRFDVYSLANGGRIATLERPVDIAVIGGRLLWTVYSKQGELALVATEAGTGRTLWRRTVWRAEPLGKPVP